MPSCRPCPCSLLFISPTSASLRLSGGRRWKIVELNVECLPPRGQARERERGQRGRGQRKIGEIVCLSRIARARRARHYVQGPRRPRPGSAGEGGRQTSHRNGALAKPTLLLKRGTQPDRSVLTRVHPCGNTFTEGCAQFFTAFPPKRCFRHTIPDCKLGEMQTRTEDEDEVKLCQQHD